MTHVEVLDTIITNMKRRGLCSIHYEFDCPTLKADIGRLEQIRDLVAAMDTEAL